MEYMDDLSSFEAELARAKADAAKEPIEHFPWGTFDPNAHIYRNKQGIWQPSVTQIIKAAGLGTDFSMVDPEWLVWKSAIGTRVHYLSDVYDLEGSVAPERLTMDTDGYVESWIGFRRISGFVPSKVSHRMLANVNGYLFGGELDKIGMLGKYPAILDLKCSMMNPPSWGFQTAAYELGYHSSPRAGRYIRGAVRLFKDGRPGQLLEHKNHDNDAMQFMSALCNVHERIRIGNLKERDIYNLELAA